EIEAGGGTVRAEGVPGLRLAVAEFAVPLERGVVGAVRGGRVADVAAKHAAENIGPITLDVHFMEVDARALRATRAEPGQDGGEACRWEVRPANSRRSLHGSRRARLAGNAR